MVLAAAAWLAPWTAWAQGTTAQEAVTGPESALLSALREAELEAERVDPGAGTVAQGAAMAGTDLTGTGLDAEFAGRLQLPALTLRVTPRLARALGLFRTDTRARRSLVAWLRLANRYRARLEARLAAEGVPSELVWVVAAESGFDPTSTSRAGAVGLWQFMPEAARTYGLRVDTWVDERRDPERSTLAAARYLRDLHARFGSWELALAAYNMGYNAVLRSIRKYNSNDFELLATLEAGLPWETVHYVPRVLSLAVAARNEPLFALGSVDPAPVVVWEDLELTASVSLSDLARRAGLQESGLRALNPALLRSRTPACEQGASFVLHVPPGTRDAVLTALAAMHPEATRVYTLRHGETVDDVASDWRTDARAILRLSGLASGAELRAGEELLVPDRDPTPLTVDGGAPVPVIAADDPATPPPSGARRVFYRVTRREELREVARALGVRREELATWNVLDAGARLQPGMWLQAYLTGTPSGARVWEERQVEVLRRGSEDFHDRAVAQTGRVRIRVTAGEGDTMETIARRYGVTVGQVARINQRNRRATLAPGDVLVLYVEDPRGREREQGGAERGPSGVGGGP